MPSAEFFNSIKTWEPTFKGLNPDQGLGALGKWPTTPGAHDCLIVGVKEGKSRFNLKNSGTQIECPSLQFIYLTLPTPENETALQWTGKPFEFPLMSDIADERDKKRFEFSGQRLKGHISTILNRSAQTADLQEALDFVASHAVGVRVYCDCNSQGQYREEKLQDRLSAEPLRSV